jgi:integrase
LEAYLARPKLRSEVHKHGVRLQLGRHLKDWMRLPLTEITKAMAVQRHREMAKLPSGANHTLRQFRSVWNHARRTFVLPECPTVAIEWYGEAPSGQLIDDLPAWAAAVDELDNPIHAVFYRLILFTGFRKGEALALEWKHIHDDRIHLPMTKNGRSFDLPIVDVHHEILRPLRGLSSKWVFPSPKASGGHLTSPERLAWTAHSHRRTFATVAMESGVLEEIVGRLLNHTPLSITGQR